MTIVIGILAAVLVILLPTGASAQDEKSKIKQKTVEGRDSYKTTVSVSSKGGVNTVKFSNWQKEYRIEFDGEFELSNDDTDIVAISRGGYFEISKSAFGSRRRVLIEADSRGDLEKQFFIGRERVDFEPEGRRWLADVLPDVVRSTTIGAESRINRFYRQGGALRVMEEVGDLNGDYLRSHYIKILLEKEDLKVDELVVIIEEAADEVDSDHYLSEILRSNERRFFESERTIEAFIEASEDIGSDHYRSEVLKSALRYDDLKPEHLSKILESASDISSDHYMSEVFKKALKEQDLTDELIGELIQAAGSISSDHYQSELFRDALRSEKVSDASYWEIINAAGDISSDHYKTELFKELLENELSSDALNRMIENIEEDVGSDHYAHILLTKIMTEQRLDNEALETMIGAIEEVGSDHYSSQIIITAANETDLSDKMVLALLEAVDDIGSDHYAAEALKSLAGFVRESGSSELRDAYHRAASGINSETFYGRAMKALY
ncbi:MAG: hypothetical protein AAGA85_23295 [Bacteroidota bacterium]